MVSTEIDELFLATLDDLEGRIASFDPYQILGISALLRKLLLDGQPLIDQVNRERRFKIRFAVGLPLGMPPGFEPPTFWSLQDGFDPDTALPGKPKTEVTRDGLLGATVFSADKKIYTVRDVILFEAHVKGGVHPGAPKTEEEILLDEFGKMFKIGGYRASLRQLQAIGRVVLKGLEELRKQVLSDLK